MGTPVRHGCCDVDGDLVRDVAASHYLTDARLVVCQAQAWCAFPAKDGVLFRPHPAIVI